MKKICPRCKNEYKKLEPTGVCTDCFDKIEGENYQLECEAQANAEYENECRAREAADAEAEAQAQYEQEQGGPDGY